MRKLATTIVKQLEMAKHCAVYEPELSRVWPGKDGKKREQAVEKFAKEHAWRLRFYKDGLCAIFDKDPDAREPQMPRQTIVQRNEGASGSNQERPMA